MAVILFLTSSFNSDAIDVLNEEIVYSVEVIRSSSSNESSYLNYAGIIQPDTTEEVNFSTISEITQIYVKDGDFVSKGQKIVSIDDEATQDRVDASYDAMQNTQTAADTSKENLNAAQINLDAAIQQRDNNPDAIEAQSNIDAAQAQVTSAQASLDNINFILEPYTQNVADAQADLDAKTLAVSSAQNEVNTATEAQVAAQKKYDDLPDSDPDKAAAKAELDTANANLGTANTALIDATAEQTAAETALRTEQAALVAEEARLGKPQAEINLQTANANLSTNQAIYNSTVAQAQLEVDARTTELNAQQIQYDSAVAAHERAEEEYNDSLESLNELTYYAKSSGTVLTVLGKVGSISTPLSPIAVIGSEGMVAEFGVSSTDAQNINQGAVAIVTIKGEKYSAEILDVAVLPDEVTRTYLTSVLIDLPPDDLLIGELVSVNIKVGSSAGVWLPIQIILNDGQSYVFVVEDGRAVRKDIEILQMDNDKVLVSGLKDNEQIISQGMKTIKSGYAVSVVE